MRCCSMLQLLGKATTILVAAPIGCVAHNFHIIGRIGQNIAERKALAEDAREGRGGRGGPGGGGRGRSTAGAQPTTSAYYSTRPLAAVWAAN